MGRNKSTEFQPDPEGNQIGYEANLTVVESALDKLRRARKKLKEARKKPNRIAFNEEAEKELDDANKRVQWVNYE